MSRLPLSFSVTDTTDGCAKVAMLARADDDDNISLQTTLTAAAPLVVVLHNAGLVAAAAAPLTTGIISTDDDDENVLTRGNRTDSQLFETGGVAMVFTSSFMVSGFNLTDGPPTTVSSSDSKPQFALRFRSRSLLLLLLLLLTLVVLLRITLPECFHTQKKKSPNYKTRPMITSRKQHKLYHERKKKEKKSGERNKKREIHVSITILTRRTSNIMIIIINGIDRSYNIKFGNMKCRYYFGL